MADFNPNPYRYFCTASDCRGVYYCAIAGITDSPTLCRGEASIPHVNEEFFKVYFIGAQVQPA